MQKKIICIALDFLKYFNILIRRRWLDKKSKRRHKTESVSGFYTESTPTNSAVKDFFDDACVYTEVFF